MNSLSQPLDSQYYQSSLRKFLSWFPSFPYWWNISPLILMCVWKLLILQGLDLALMTHLLISFKSISLKYMLAYLAFYNICGAGWEVDSMKEHLSQSYLNIINILTTLLFSKIFGIMNSITNIFVFLKFLRNVFCISSCYTCVYLLNVYINSVFIIFFILLWILDEAERDKNEIKYYMTGKLWRARNTFYSYVINTTLVALKCLEAWNITTIGIESRRPFHNYFNSNIWENGMQNKIITFHDVSLFLFLFLLKYS